MKFLRLTIVAVTVAAFLTGATAGADEAHAIASTEHAMTFPSVTGRDLNGRTLQLPKDLAGDYDLLYVAFVQRQQGDVDTWKTFGEAAAKKHPNLKVYELPVLGRGYSLMRGFIDGGMRNAIKDEAARAATVTLYIDKTPFRKALGLTGEDEIAVLVIKRDGTVLSKTLGRYDAATAPDLDALLK